MESSFLTHGIFWVLAALAVGSACIVTFARSIIYSAMALLGTFMGVAGLFIFASSDFVAVIQVLVYVGGVLLLILFAVMLTAKVGTIEMTNQSRPWWLAAGISAALLAILGKLLWTAPWMLTEDVVYVSTIKALGSALLTDYLLPFEVVSVLLLAVLIGAVVMVRREVKS